MNRPIPGSRWPASSTHNCGRPGCERQCQLGHFLCARDWLRCPPELRTRLTAAYRAVQSNPTWAAQQELRAVQADTVEHFRMEYAARK